MRPLPVFLRDATPEEAREVIVNLGHCIKNNAAANVFNKDLDARNYGVSRFQKVFLFDYDALEPLTRVKVRSNVGRFDGEDDVPDWFYEDGVIFLPEEIESGFRIHDRGLRRLFRDVHGDLLTTGYWERMQHDLDQDRCPASGSTPSGESSITRAGRTHRPESESRATVLDRGTESSKSARAESGWPGPAPQYPNVFSCAQLGSSGLRSPIGTANASATRVRDVAAGQGVQERFEVLLLPLHQAQGADQR